MAASAILAVMMLASAILALTMAASSICAVLMAASAMCPCQPQGGNLGAVYCQIGYLRIGDGGVCDMSRLDSQKVNVALFNSRHADFRGGNCAVLNDGAVCCDGVGAMLSAVMPPVLMCSAEIL